MSHDDDALDVTRVLSGETEAFSGIVARHQQVVVRFAGRFFRERADVEDFVQEVFLQAYRRLATYRNEGGLRSWLFAIAYHHAVRTRRVQPDYASLDEQLITDPMPDPERAALRRETCAVIREAIRRLPARFAACLDLYFFFGLTYAEISRTTGYPVNTVRSHIRRAKERLHAALSRELPEGCHDL